MSLRLFFTACASIIAAADGRSSTNRSAPMPTAFGSSSPSTRIRAIASLDGDSTTVAEAHVVGSPDPYSTAEPTASVATRSGVSRLESASATRARPGPASVSPSRRKASSASMASRRSWSSICSRTTRDSKVLDNA